MCHPAASHPKNHPVRARPRRDDDAGDGAAGRLVVLPRRRNRPHLRRRGHRRPPARPGDPIRRPRQDRPSCLAPHRGVRLARDGDGVARAHVVAGRLRPTRRPHPPTDGPRADRSRAVERTLSRLNGAHPRMMTRKAMSAVPAQAAGFAGGSDPAGRLWTVAAPRLAPHRHPTAGCAGHRADRDRVVAPRRARTAPCGRAARLGLPHCSRHPSPAPPPRPRSGREVDPRARRGHSGAPRPRWVVGRSRGRRVPPRARRSPRRCAPVARAPVARESWNPARFPALRGCPRASCGAAGSSSAADRSDPRSAGST